MSPREEPSNKITEQTPGLLSTAESDGNSSTRTITPPDEEDGTMPNQEDSTPASKPPSPPKRGGRFSIATRNR